MARTHNNGSMAWTVVKTIFWIAFIFIVVALDVAYLVIKKSAPEKVVSNDFYFDMQKAEDGSHAYPIEVNYFKNKNGNGLEVFEIKLNYLTDEAGTSIYSQGLQFVANESKNLEWSYKVDETHEGQKVGGKAGWYSGEWHYNYWGTMFINEDIGGIYNYASSDEYEHTWGTANPLDSDFKFRLQTGEGEDKKVFLLDFVDKEELEEIALDENAVPEDNMSYRYKEVDGYKFWLAFGYNKINYYYAYYDINFLSYMLYNMVKDAPDGTNTVTNVELVGDMFDYYIYDNGITTQVADDNLDLVKTEIFNYYKIKVTVSDDGLKKADESIFNTVKGNTTYNMTGNYSEGDYFYGRPVLNLSLKDFDMVLVYDDKHVALKLKQDFLDTYLADVNKVLLKIDIDKDYLTDQNLTFVGVADNSGLENFNIVKFVLSEYTNGSIIETEVEYA